MPSKQKGGNTEERAPLQLDDAENVDDEVDEEICIEQLPISIAPKWNEQYQDPVAFDENADEQYSKSLFFNKNDNGLFTEIFDRYDWKSLSEHFGDKTIKIASQLTLESANDSGTVNFMSYSKLPFSHQLAAIYQLIIQFAKSMNPSDNNSDDDQNEDNDNNNNKVYPWNLIYPQSEETGLPIKSKNGLYFVKLFFCGEWRSILIDDNVPMFDNKFLFPTISDSNELWPQLLTKAILKFLILSNRLNQEISIPFIVQLLTSFVPLSPAQMNKLKDQDVPFKYIACLDKTNIIKKIKLDDLQDWTMTTTLNNFAISDTIIENQDCWIIANFESYPKQTMQDLWSSDIDKKYTNDDTIIISKESTEIDIILQINSLNKNLSEKVGLFIYDQTKNIKKIVEIMPMNHGFASMTATIEPNKIYIIEVEGNISYSSTIYSKSSNIHISPKFGDEKIWEIANHKMINIESECKQHSISQTFILFNIHINVTSENCNILFHSAFNDQVLSNSVVLYCVNLDDHSMQYIPNLNLSKFNIAANKVIIHFCFP